MIGAAPGTSTGTPIASRRGPRVRLLVSAAFVAFAIATGVSISWRTALDAERLRALRVETQREVNLSTSLERGAARLPVLAPSLDRLRLAIVEATDRVADRADLRARLRISSRRLDVHALAGDGSVLRLRIDARISHAGVLIDLVDALVAAVPGRPVDLAGCRLERVPLDGSTPDPLVASCAFDWPWWPWTEAHEKGGRPT